MSKIKFFLVSLLCSFIFSVSIARNIVIFNNHSNVVHVRQQYEGEKSHTVQIKPGDFVFIEDYSENLISYYLPDKSSITTGLGYRYKTYPFDKEEDEDVLVVLYPSFEEHGVDWKSIAAGAVFVIGVSVVSGPVAGIGAGGVVGKIIKEAFKKAERGIRAKVVPKGGEISVKRGIYVHTLEEIDDGLESGEISQEFKELGFGDEDEEGEGELSELEEDKIFAVQYVFKIGEKLMEIRESLLERAQSFNEVISQSDEEEGESAGVESFLQLIERDRGILQRITGKLFILSERLGARFCDEIESLEKGTDGEERYIGAEVVVQRKPKNFLSSFNEFIDNLIGQMEYLRAKASYLQESLADVSPEVLESMEGE